MTFDDWNRQETKRIAQASDSATAKHVRRARKGGLFRFMAYDDYVEFCEANGIAPEALVA